MTASKLSVGMHIAVSREKIENFCTKWHITSLEVFGSAIRGDFTSDSDIDILFTYNPSHTPTLFDLVDMKEELEKIFGRNVDFISKKGIEEGSNKLRAKEILSTARSFYVKAA